MTSKHIFSTCLTEKPESGGSKRNGSSRNYSQETETRPLVVCDLMNYLSAANQIRKLHLANQAGVSRTGPPGVILNPVQSTEVKC